mgnify:CR=1 FL=1
MQRQPGEDCIKYSDKGRRAYRDGAKDLGLCEKQAGQTVKRQALYKFVAGTVATVAATTQLGSDMGAASTCQSVRLDA